MTRYRWVADRKAEGFPITMACAVAEVSRQAFYDWRLRVVGGPSEAEQAEAGLVSQMRGIHDEFDKTYGSPRMTVELANQGNQVVNHKRVERLMRLYGIVGVHKPAKVRTTIRAEHDPPLPDLLRRDFTVGRPDVAWVSDITYIPTGEGWLYLATVLDLGSRRLLGYSMATHMRTSLISRRSRDGSRRQRRRDGRDHLPLGSWQPISCHESSPRRSPATSDGPVGRTHRAMLGQLGR